MLPTRGWLARDIERREAWSAKPIRCRKLWLDAACNILRQAMLNIGPPTDGHAAVMYGGREGGGVTLRAGCRIVADRPRAIRSTRVSTVFALISGYVYFRGMRVGLELRVELTFPVGSLGPISFYNILFGDEDLEWKQRGEKERGRESVEWICCYLLFVDIRSFSRCRFFKILNSSQLTTCFLIWL